MDARDRAISMACRAAMQLLEGAPDREVRLRRVDPVPQSTRELLAALPRRNG